MRDQIEEIGGICVDEQHDAHIANAIWGWSNLRIPSPSDTQLQSSSRCESIGINDSTPAESSLARHARE